MPEADFQRLRPLLLSVAYGMIGSATEAEDIVQEAFARFYERRSAGEDVRSPKRLFTTIVTRLCIDYLRSARRQREAYPGTWLPEPLPTDIPRENCDGSRDPAEAVERRGTVSYALLVLLERLTPIERAVFLLREVYEYDYDEIAAIVGKKQPNCRQIFRRAREAVRAGRPRFTPSVSERERLVSSFLSACRNGDMAQLERLLADEVTAYSDGGGIVSSATRPVVGRARVLRFVAGVIDKTDWGIHELRAARINGEPGMIALESGLVFFVVIPEFDGQRIRTMRTILNPEKLGRVGRVAASRPGKH